MFAACLFAMIVASSTLTEYVKSALAETVKPFIAGCFSCILSAIRFNLSFNRVLVIVDEKDVEIMPAVSMTALMVIFEARK